MRKLLASPQCSTQDQQGAGEQCGSTLKCSIQEYQGELERSVPSGGLRLTDLAICVMHGYGLAYRHIMTLLL